MFGIDAQEYTKQPETENVRGEDSVSAALHGATNNDRSLAGASTSTADSYRAFQNESLKDLANPSVFNRFGLSHNTGAEAFQLSPTRQAELEKALPGLSLASLGNAAAGKQEVPKSTGEQINDTVNYGWDTLLDPDEEYSNSKTMLSSADNNTAKGLLPTVALFQSNTNLMQDGKDYSPTAVAYADRILTPGHVMG